MEMQSQKLERLLSMKRAGWANLPETGSILGLTIPAGHRAILVERATGCIILSDDGKPTTRPEPNQFRRAIRYDRNAFKKHAIDFEGFAQHMYLDVKGNVTVGIGHLIPDAEAAAKLKFHHRETNGESMKTQRKGKVDAMHKRNAYLKVLNSGITNGSLEAFKDVTHIDLDPVVIGDIFRNDVKQFIHELNCEFPDFETYPASAQLGMLDLIYNIGRDNFCGGFPVFQKALEFRNWIKVAEESHRLEEINGKHNETMERRNEVVRGWFLDAIKDEPFFLNPDCPPKRLSMIPG
ncbi:MAG: hypothetical protein IIA73_08460 [Proteobacteria bacterium]|nr:hypothetical protein [Pseudomonadota bacterium]